MSDPLTLLAATIMAFSAVGILCYTAGADKADRAEWCDECAAHARDRHPSSR